MRALKPPVGEPMEIFKSIINKKKGARKQVLAKSVTDIFFAFSSYKLARLHLLFPVCLNDSQREALVHCYTSEVVPFADLRQELLEAAGTICPYCEIDRAETLDHFIPKEHYPEFAVFSFNLVPCCDVCNRKKGTKWATMAGRLFWHSYFDQVPADSDCLKATITWKGKAPKFSFTLTPCSQINAELYQIIQEHFSRLELLEWYAKKAGEEFDNQADWSVEEITEPIARKQIERNIKKKREAEGPFSWRAALWEAVLLDSRAVNSLCI